MARIRYIECDACGKKDSMQGKGWLEYRDEDDYVMDLCPDCVRLFFEWSKGKKAQHKSGSMRIEKLGLSIRPNNLLLRAGIKTVGDLVEKTPDELMYLRNMGKKSYQEINEKLESLGFDRSGY